MNRAQFQLYSFDDLGKIMTRLTLEGLISLVTFDSIQEFIGDRAHIKVIVSGHDEAESIFREFHRSYL